MAAERRYRALLVANGTFPDDPEQLRPLKGSANDVKLVLEALTDRDRGLHAPGDVQIVLDKSRDEIVEVMEDFFVSARPADQLLLYYSGHGVPDRQDRLYLCARNTRIERLVARAISDQEITRLAEASKAQATAIILDCCYSGNFKTTGPDPADRLGGKGRFVLASSRAGELSDDASDVNGASLFTRHLVQGLLAGATVDRDGDGLVTIADLHHYVSERLAAEDSSQRPHQHFDGEGALVLARAPKPLTRAAEPAAGLPPRLWNVPHERNPNFTGRDPVLQQLRELLDRPDRLPVAITGLGGVGKTRVVVEYAVRHWSDYELVWWLRADDPATLASDYAQLGAALGIDEHDPHLAAEQLRRLLADHDRWLLIFDNAEDPADLAGYLPAQGGGQVLITARNPAWGSTAASIALEVLDHHDATALLLKRSRQTDQQAARALAAALGDLPIALEQAGAYLEATAMPLADYLTLFQRRQEDLAAIGAPGSTERTVATTWSLAFEQVEQTSSAAVQLLRLGAFLSPDDIPVNLLTSQPDLLPAELAESATDPISLNHTIAVLRRHALLERKADLLAIHRLVQVAVRRNLTPTDRQHWAGMAVGLLAAAFPGDHANPSHWSRCAQLLPHLLTVTGHTKELGIDPDTTAKLLNDAGMYLLKQADHQQARTLFERALAICETRLGADHLTTAQSLSNLGLVRYAQGDVASARSFHERALAIRETRLGTDHPETAKSLSNLAGVLSAQGDLDGARTLLERTLTIFEANLGPDHLATAQSLNNLAIVLHEQGDLDGARSLLKRALAIREAHLGADHPDTATSLSNLAGVLAGQGDLQGARPLLERALAIREARLGADHPTAAWSLTSLAGVLHDQGDLDTARTLYERALRIWEARLGADHPDTVRSREQLALVVAALENRQ